MFQPFFPPTARPLWLIGAFVLALVVFHLLLICWLRLGPRGWKYVDYIWLSVAAVGLLGAATEVRRMVAASQMNFANAHKVAAYQLLVRDVGSTSSGAVCRPFQRSEFSPPNLDQLEREYDRVCAFGQRLRAGLPPDPPVELDRQLFEQRPAVSDRMLNGIYRELDAAVLQYTAVEKAVADTGRAAERSEWELTLSMLTPFLLAVALALRITKVTGELGLLG